MQILVKFAAQRLQNVHKLILDKLTLNKLNPSNQQSQNALDHKLVSALVKQ
jgi:hypothetical protein